MTSGPGWADPEGFGYSKPLEDWGPGPFGDFGPAGPVGLAPAPEPCHDCRGSGADAEAPGNCPTCGGWGTILR